MTDQDQTSVGVNEITTKEEPTEAMGLQPAPVHMGSTPYEQVGPSVLHVHILLSMRLDAWFKNLVPRFDKSVHYEVRCSDNSCNF